MQALAEPEAQPTPRRAKPELQSAAAAWLVAAEAASVKPDAAAAVTEAVAAGEAVAEAVVASGEATTELSAASIRRMKVAELRDALAARELPTDGLKPALAARLMQHCAGAAPPPGTSDQPAAPAAATPSKATAKTPGSTLRSRAMRSTTRR